MSKKKRSDSKLKPQERRNRYGQILSQLFANHYKTGLTEFPFLRSEIQPIAEKLAIELPKNLGDLIYSFRYRRTETPVEIRQSQPEGLEWEILPAGKGKYRMKLLKICRIVPSNQPVIEIPDATPELVARHAFTDEQALLAKIRYNRLIDIFLRVTAYSLQSHLRTSVRDMGQMEIDELYFGIRNTGDQCVIPVQAKGGKERLGVVQVIQDLAFCNVRFSGVTPRPVAVQFEEDDEGEIIVMFELEGNEDELRVSDEKHYRLVPPRKLLRIKQKKKKKKK